MENYIDISDINLSKLEISETNNFGHRDKLILKIDGKKVCQFYFNMRGYNQDFFLKNKENVSFGFGGEKPKNTQISEFKKAVKSGYIYIKNY